MHDTNDPQDLLRSALVKIKELKRSLREAHESASEPIAVIGMSCRFPGGGDGLDAFFQSLLAGTDGVRRIPPERWLAGTRPADRPELRWAGLLDAIDGFDASYFGISPREAVLMDPQQRLLLEVVSEALQHAGAREERLMGSPTGVFLGMCNADYEHLVRRSRDAEPYRATGNMLSTAAGRLSYVLGLQGPCLTLDTACSSSLVAVHLAVQSLRNRECELALAGGVNMILDPTTMVMLAETQALSPDGRCRAFDARANGFVRGEGCGIVVLKRLSDASRDGDAILAVIRGSAVNQDGRSMGMTAPSVLSQQAMLRQALRNAGVAPADVGYVETHGTGTSLGDPIEIDALREVLGAPRSDGSRCVLGALKSNIGHLEAAAGVAGLIKAVLCLVHGVIPKNLHFQALNPRIALEGTPFVIPNEPITWERSDKPRLVGVSSFGLSGTNAHVVLEEGPAPAKPEVMDAEGSRHLLVLSAKSSSALTSLAGAYKERLIASSSDERLSDIVRCAAIRRSHHEYRLAVVGASKEELVRALDAHLRGESRPTLVHRTSHPSPSSVVLVFAGQGSQWVGMGTVLLDEDPVFAEALHACDAALAPHLGFSVIEQLRRSEDDSRLAETLVAQPALFAIEVALAAMLRSAGVVPTGVIGHSVGEITAAHVAGILDLDQAARLVAIRARTMQEATGKGRMISVELSEPLAEQAIAGFEGQVGVAAINSPTQTVLSGDVEAVEAIQERLTAQGVEVRPLRVDYAFHSPQMDPLRASLVAELSFLEPKPGNLAMFSTVTGERVSGDRLDASYWGDNVRKAVRLAPTVARAARDARCVFLEVGPHPVLSIGIEQTLAEHGLEGRVLHTLRRRRDERTQMLLALANLYIDGVELDWTKLHPGPGPVVELPYHPWQRTRHWLDLGKRSDAVEARRWVRGHASHPLLGGPLVASPTHPEEHVWESLLSVAALPYLADHRVREQIVFPAAGYMEMALAAAKETFGADTLVLEEVGFDRMLVLEQGEECVVQVVLAERGPGRCEVRIASLDDEALVWNMHGRGMVSSLDTAKPPPTIEHPSSMRARLGEPSSAEQHQQRMRARELHYGPTFQGLVEIWTGEGEALGRVVLPEGPSTEGHVLHPALLDACLQLSTAVVESGASEVLLPVGLDRLVVHRIPLRRVWVVATHRSSEQVADDDLRCNLKLVDDEGEVLVELDGFRLRRMAARPEHTSSELDEHVLEVAWRPLEPAGEGSLPADGTWLLLMDHGGVGTAIGARLAARGQRCIRVVPGKSFEQLEPDLMSIDVANPDDYRRLVHEGLGGAGRPVGVVHLFGLDATASEATTVQSLHEDLLTGSISVVYLVQALASHGFERSPRLYVVTRGAQALGEDESIAIAQAPVLGLGKTIALEHPELRCTRIDLGPAPDVGEIDAVVRELAADDDEDQVALRSTGRYGVRIVKGSFPPSAGREPLGFAEPSFRADGSYLVTGGLGGLGLELARWLVEQGARHLVLVGRRGPGPEAQSALRAMEEAGAHVRVESVDVSSPEQVAGLFARFGDTTPALRGVVHTAAMLDDHTLLGQSERSFRLAFAAKAIGAWNVHQASMRLPLDFFVMYSSAASLLGSPGQSNYGAANAFLDALAHERHRQGLHGLSVQWGAFSEVGMAAAAEDRGARLSTRGIASMTPAEGLQALHRLLEQPERAEVGIVSFDPHAWAASQPAVGSLPFFAEILASGQGAAKHENEEVGWREVALLSKDEASRVIIDQLIRLVSKVLQIDASSELLEPTRFTEMRFSALGVDSLMANELRNQVRGWADVDIPATMMIGGSRISEVVELVYQKALVRSLVSGSEHESQDAEIFIL